MDGQEKREMTQQERNAQMIREHKEQKEKAAAEQKEQQPKPAEEVKQAEQPKAAPEKKPKEKALTGKEKYKKEKEEAEAIIKEIEKKKAEERTYTERIALAEAKKRKGMAQNKLTGYRNQELARTAARLKDEALMKIIKANNVTEENQLQSIFRYVKETKPELIPKPQEKPAKGKKK